MGKTVFNNEILWFKTVSEVLDFSKNIPKLGSEIEISRDAKNWEYGIFLGLKPLYSDCELMFKVMDENKLCFSTCYCRHKLSNINPEKMIDIRKTGGFTVLNEDSLIFHKCVNHIECKNENR